MAAIGQIVCECGNVAEIRRRKNGRKLPFKSCKSCGVQQGKENLREKWLEEMQEPGFFGVYGKPPRGQEPDAPPEIETINPQVNADKKILAENPEETPPKPKRESNTSRGLLAAFTAVVVGVVLVNR